MKKQIILTALLPLLWGCDSFLDVNPKSIVKDDEMFATASKCEDAIYGIYGEMGRNLNLQGFNLSFAFPELMIGNFFSNQVSEFAYPTQRLWDNSKSIKFAEDTWTAAYQVIGYINNAAEHILPMPDDRFQYTRLYKGELLALRAYMHFEVARLFAVSFGSTNAAAKAKAIPYVTSYGMAVTSYNSLQEVYGKIVTDLKAAEGYLAEDASLIPAVRTNASNGFPSCRILHLNLYAVKALLARAYWTMGDLEQAEIYAQQVIDSGKFPLMRNAEDWNEADNGTLSLKETLFGLYSGAFLGRYYNLHGTTGNTNELSVDREHYRGIYDNDGNDNRIKYWFNDQLGQCVKHLNKMYLSGSGTPTYVGKSIMGLSQIRIPEMYYIVAEANLTKNPAKAMARLDDVVAARGLVRFADRENVTGITADDIFRERLKEFFGDGQNFHNMKRLRKDVTIKGLDTYPGTDDATYTMPIPASVEDNFRD